MSKTKGERVGPPRKLTADGVREIRRRYWNATRLERVPLGKLADEFGVSRITIWHVANGYTWKHVT